MTSYQSFIPGAFRKLNQLTGSTYNLEKTQTNTYNLELRNIQCLCFRDSYKMLKTAENDPRYQSNTLRVSSILRNNSGQGGRIEFGNTYLNNDVQPLIDILGSVEGQPGGSYTPLRNKF